MSSSATNILSGVGDLGLPFDILTSIFARLTDPRDVGACRSVCKLWSAAVPSSIQRLDVPSGTSSATFSLALRMFPNLEVLFLKPGFRFPLFAEDGSAVMVGLAKECPRLKVFHARQQSLLPCKLMRADALALLLKCRQLHTLSIAEGDVPSEVKEDCKCWLVKSQGETYEFKIPPLGSVFHVRDNDQLSAKGPQVCVTSRHSLDPAIPAFLSLGLGSMEDLHALCGFPSKTLLHLKLSIQSTLQEDYSDHVAATKRVLSLAATCTALISLRLSGLSLTLGGEGMNREGREATAWNAEEQSQCLSLLGALQGLQLLSICGNAADRSFNGGMTLPPSLLSLQGLKSLSLGSLHSLDDIFTVCQFSQLEELSVVCCGISTIPPAIASLSRLRALEVSLCPLAAHSIPEALGFLQSLHRLALTNLFGLVALPSAIGDLGELELLDLSGCNNLKRLPETLVTMRALRELKLDGCEDLSDYSYLQNVLPELTVYQRNMKLTRTKRIYDFTTSNQQY